MLWDSMREPSVDCMKLEVSAVFLRSFSCVSGAQKRLRKQELTQPQSALKGDRILRGSRRAEAFTVGEAYI